MDNLSNLDILVMNAKQLHRDALTALYDKYLPHVFRYIYYQVDDRAVAEDLTSETFVKMLTAIPDFREGGRSFYPWLLRIAKNTTFDYLRSKSKEPYVLLDEEIEELIFDRGNTFDLEHAVIRDLDAEEVKKAVRKLTEEQQQVLLLKFTMGLSNAQVGKVLDKTEGSVKSLQVRALSSLKRLLGGQHRPDERIEPMAGIAKREPVKQV
ncbi:MAG TPA: sigma-70 family RNA polymerase sigma factor [Anaerolineae bacterium]|jgi:RNA polymerase sigma-70 factor (ECF subfamily)|nr:sigma-70 family RNA polymerase sigma factor [Anaerolineae bacterium]